MRISDWSSDVCSSDLSPVALPEHHVDRAQYGGRVRKHVAPRHHVHRLKVAERRRPDFAAIGFVGAVRHQIDDKFALGAFGRHINLPGGHVKARSEEHTSDLQSLIRRSYAALCLKKKRTTCRV